MDDPEDPGNAKVSGDRTIANDVVGHLLGAETIDHADAERDRTEQQQRAEHANLPGELAQAEGQDGHEHQWHGFRQYAQPEARTAAKPINRVPVFTEAQQKAQREQYEEGDEDVEVAMLTGEQNANRIEGDCAQGQPEAALTGAITLKQSVSEQEHAAFRRNQ